MTTIIVMLVLGAGIAAAISNQNTPKVLVAQDRAQGPAVGVAAPAQRSADRAADTPCTVTLSGYSWLTAEMTYASATDILGCYGEELSTVEIAGYKTVMYMWRGNSFGANMNATFQNNRLVSKAQFGLN